MFAWNTATVVTHSPLILLFIPSSIIIRWRWILLCHQVWDPLSLFTVDANVFLQPLLHHRGTREMVAVVLWYIYSCQSETSWDSDEINSWDDSQYQGAHTPFMQAIPVYLIHPEPIPAVRRHLSHIHIFTEKLLCCHQGAKANNWRKLVSSWWRGALIPQIPSASSPFSLSLF